MNQSELIEKVARATELNQAAAGQAVKAVVNAILDSLVAGGAVRVSGLGTFIHRNDRAHIEDVVLETVALFGADRCLFGSECPGVGSAIDPDTGRTMDHIRPHIEKFEWLSQADREKIFAGNARKVFNLKI